MWLRRFLKARRCRGDQPPPSCWKTVNAGLLPRRQPGHPRHLFDGLEAVPRTTAPGRRARRRRERLGCEHREPAQLIAQSDKLHAKATKAVAAQNMARRARRLLASVEPGRSVTRWRRSHLRARTLRQDATHGEEHRRATARWVFTGVDLAIDRGSRVCWGSAVPARRPAQDPRWYRSPTPARCWTDTRPQAGLFRPGAACSTCRPRAGEHAGRGLSSTTRMPARCWVRSCSPRTTTEAGPCVVGRGEGAVGAGDPGGRSAANVLLLDEPTNNLDPSREQVLGAIRSYKGAIVLVTGEVPWKALEPDRVLLLPDGDEDL